MSADVHLKTVIHSGKRRMRAEPQRIRALYTQLLSQPCTKFPPARHRLDAPKKQGVYIIRKGDTVYHVGRTTRAKNGLHQRLSDHLGGQSSFTRVFFDRDGKKLRSGFTFQCLVVENPRHRAILEAYAAGSLCPKHMGVGLETTFWRQKSWFHTLFRKE